MASLVSRRRRRDLLATRVPPVVVDLPEGGTRSVDARMMTMHAGVVGTAVPRLRMRSLSDRGCLQFHQHVGLEQVVDPDQ